MVIILISNSVVLVTKNDKSSIQESTSLVEAAELNTVSVITRKKLEKALLKLGKSILTNKDR